MLGKQALKLSGWLPGGEVLHLNHDLPEASLHLDYDNPWYLHYSNKAKLDDKCEHLCQQWILVFRIWLHISEGLHVRSTRVIPPCQFSRTTVQHAQRSSAALSVMSRRMVSRDEKWALCDEDTTKSSNQSDWILVARLSVTSSSPVWFSRLEIDASRMSQKWWCWATFALVSCISKNVPMEMPWSLPGNHSTLENENTFMQAM